MRCWDVCDGAPFGCVVFAPKRKAARRLGTKHLQGVGIKGDFYTVAIERLPSSSGQAGNHLSAALARETGGIGHRLSCGGWMILPPGIHPARSERATPTGMHSFVDGEERQFVLFAHNDERSADLHRAIVDKLAFMPKGWSGSKWDWWQLTGSVRHQREAEWRGIEGVGVYTRRGWQILPLDYEMFGIDPPDG